MKIVKSGDTYLVDSIIYSNDWGEEWT
jgi:hypothetical protein